MTKQSVLSTETFIYLEHILHGQIETKDFWIEQMMEWETDTAGNIPLEQFNLILQEVSSYDYIKYLFNTVEAPIAVSCVELGKGVISEIDEINDYVTCVFSFGKMIIFTREQFINRQWDINY